MIVAFLGSTAGRRQNLGNRRVITPCVAEALLQIVAGVGRYAHIGVATALCASRARNRWSTATSIARALKCRDFTAEMLDRSL
jgi:hypothetical protein